MTIYLAGNLKNRILTIFTGHLINTQYVGRTTDCDSHNSDFMAISWTFMFGWDWYIIVHNSNAKYVWKIVRQIKVCIQIFDISPTNSKMLH